MVLELEADCHGKEHRLMVRNVDKMTLVAVARNR